MPLEQSTLDAVKNKKFTEFSNAVKQELKQKLSNHKVTKKYVSDYDKIKQMKDSFAKIANTNKQDNDDVKDNIDNDVKDNDENE
jgi:hypothetical protein